jgi:hypothetical protein
LNIVGLSTTGFDPDQRGSPWAAKSKSQTARFPNIPSIFSPPPVGCETLPMLFPLKETIDEKSRAFAIHCAFAGVHCFLR